jgi:hypothetical protein
MAIREYGDVFGGANHGDDKRKMTTMLMKMALTKMKILQMTMIKITMMMMTLMKMAVMMMTVMKMTLGRRQPQQRCRWIRKDRQRQQV